MLSVGIVVSRTKNNSRGLAPHNQQTAFPLGCDKERSDISKHGELSWHTGDSTGLALQLPTSF